MSKLQASQVVSEGLLQCCVLGVLSRRWQTGGEKGKST